MNSKLLQYFQIILTLALIVFIVLKAGDFFSKVDWHIILNNWPSFFLAGAIFLCGYVIMARHWVLACELSTKQKLKKQWLAFFASQPYKYLPTSIFSFSSRATFAKKQGLGFKQSTEAQVIENFNLIGSALVGGFVLLLLVNYFYYGLLTVALIGLVLLSIWYKSKITIPKLKLELDLKKWIVSLGVVSIGWLVMGLGFFVITVSLENRFEPVLAVAANSLATGLGIAAVFAPGGIGVREVVFSYLGFASTTILLWRFTTFVIDIAVGAWAGWAISRGRK